MKKISFLILITTLSLGISSCSYFESFNDKRKEVEEASKPTIKINATAEGEAQEEEEKDPLAEAVEEAEATKREQDIIGLIPSTKPEVRVSNSVRGRQDPFSTIAVQPQIEIEPEEVDDFDEGRDNFNNGATRPDNITSTPTIETLETPEPPDKSSLTELAQNVVITGLVNLGDRIRLIVQAPEEATSRYVDVGQYISNGQVLVKRIETSSPTPTVILEQSGIEVARTIGEPVAESTDDRALLPPPPVSLLSN